MQIFSTQSGNQGRLASSPHSKLIQEAQMMFSGIEFVIGGLGALIGIGGGYLMLNAFFAGIQRIAKPRTVEVKNVKDEERLDN